MPSPRGNVRRWARTAALCCLTPGVLAALVGSITGEGAWLHRGQKGDSDGKQHSQQPQEMGCVWVLMLIGRTKPKRVGHPSKKKKKSLSVYLYLVKYLLVTFVTSLGHLPAGQTARAASPRWPGP